MLREPAVPRKSPLTVPLTLSAALVILLSACASIPPPTGAMSRARSSLKAAQQAGAADADPVDLEFARGKLEQANKAISDGKNGLAGDLAEESLADSQLALTKARLASMRARVQSQLKENQRLRKQLLERAAGHAAAAEPASASSVQELPQTVLPMPAPPSSAPPAPQPAAAGSSRQGGE